MNCPSKSLADYRLLIEAALAYEGYDTTFADIADAVEKGEAQAWYGPNSIGVTQIDEQPRTRILQLSIAAGAMAELEAMLPYVLEWGRDHGCTVARLVGRKGWTRSFLTRTGWQDKQLVIMERRIDASYTGRIKEQEQDHKFGGHGTGRTSATAHG